MLLYIRPLQLASVPLELASVFIDKPGQSKDSSSKRKTRETHKGRILTHESELTRMREKKDAEKKMQEEKRARIEERKRKKLEKEQEKRASSERREQAKQLRNEQSTIIATNGGLSRANICNSCGKKVKKNEKAQCLICKKRFHGQCVGAQSFAICCDECLTK